MSDKSIAKKFIASFKNRRKNKDCENLYGVLVGKQD
ncbi:hypothetical protein HB2014_50 [Salmonella phage vB_SPuM_SP116]|uniref:Uncharacterized protein n=1 Tax=Salmonella phage vB_SPuM_SP116 TaxID=1567025 RepID=A0A0D4DAU6_9CAUD|nr:hypothetical protein HB2014_50 [Salmonella phage vB_SPuM_SP116]AJT60624.1 hypothetical protein HB2014_50 [Salmonella phage vB_SPuM_SP116]